MSETKSGNSVFWSSTTIYDGWQQRKYDPKGNRTDYNNDGFGQLSSVTEYNYVASNETYTTSYSYNLLGNLTGVTDAAGNVTSIHYNMMGWKSSMTDPDMGSWEYYYDGVGNLTWQKDGRGLWLVMAYDDLHRLVNKRRDNASGALSAEYVYDAAGQKGLLSKSRSYNNAGTTIEVEIQNVNYDVRNRLTQQNTVVNGVGTFRMDSAYNEADQKISSTYPGGTAGQQGEIVSYGYNALGQLITVSGLGGIQYVSSASYNTQGQMTQVVNENGNGATGLTRQFVYNATTLRLETVRAGTVSPFENLQKLSYSYDKNGNVTNLTDSTNSNQVQSFGYDWLNRLVSASTNAVGTGQYNQSYLYNAIGNITSFAGNPYTYGDPAHKHAVTAAFGNTYGYDANGNQTTRTIAGITYTYTFDYENRITAISGGSSSASFVYDASGQRVKGTVNGVTTVYIGGVYEYQAGATTLYYEGNAIRRSGYASNNGVTYLLQDHLKSSSAVVNQNGTLNGNRNYFLPFGGNRGGAAFNDVTTKRFTGQYHEASLPGGEGLSYYSARWYDAKLGRFLSADSIVPGAGNPQALNRYSYVFNNPLGYRDPSGHAPISGPLFDPGPSGGSKPPVKPNNPLPTYAYGACTVCHVQNQAYELGYQGWVTAAQMDSSVNILRAQENAGYQAMLFAVYMYVSAGAMGWRSPQTYSMVVEELKISSVDEEFVYLSPASRMKLIGATEEGVYWEDMGSNPVGTMFWGTTGAISDRDAIPAIKQLAGRETSVHIISGAHGFPGGMHLEQDLQFYADDVALWMQPRHEFYGENPVFGRVTVYNYWNMSEQQIRNLGGRGQVCLVNWCSSSQDQFILRLLQ